MATISNITVCNRALTLLGANIITSFEDGTAEAESCSELYDYVVDKELAPYPWTFATKEIKLGVPLTAKPDTYPWTNAYQIPSEAQYIRTVKMSSGQKIEWDRFANKVYVATDDDAELIMQATYRLAENDWSMLFLNFIVDCLAAALAMPVTEDGNLAAGRLRELERVRKDARNADARQRRRTDQRITGKRLVTARHSGR